MKFRGRPLSDAWLVAIYMLATLVIGYGGYVFASIRTINPVKHLALIPSTSIDDRIYNIFLAQPQVCLQNFTSTLAEGGCRMQLLWTLGAYSGKLLGLQAPGVTTIALRIILLALLGLAFYYFNRAWSRRTHQDPRHTMGWLAALIVFMPVPLLFLNLGHELADASLIVATFASPPDIFSILMSLICVGGLYLSSENPRAWSTIGALAGIWAFLHPYFMFFWLTLAVVWLAKSRSLVQMRPLPSLLLILPTILVGGYYAWLAVTNQFFRYHLSSNVTGYDPRTMIALFAGACLSLALAMFILRKDDIRLSDISKRFGPFLLTWLAVGTVWAIIPTYTSRRMSLVLLVPLAIAVTRLVTLPGAKLFRRYILLMLIVNFVILTLISVVAQGQYFESDLRSRTVTPLDRQAAAYLATRPQDYYIGSTRAIIRFPWLSRTRMLNVQNPESPELALWNNLLNELILPNPSCAAVQSRLLAGHISGIILDTATKPREMQGIASCGYEAVYDNPDWVIYSIKP